MDETDPNVQQLWTEQQAIDVVHAWCAAREHRDLETLGALCVDDVDLTIDSRVIARGRDDLLRLLELDLARRPFVMLFPTAGRVRAVGTSELVVEMDVLGAVTDLEAAGGPGARWWSDRRRVVLRRMRDSWRICSVELGPRKDADYDAGWGSTLSPG